MGKSCIVLLSGGLDSLLAVRLMTAQGLRVVALHSINCFHGTQTLEEKKRKLREDALRLGASDILFPDITGDVIEVTKSPRFGYGRNLNACIDCRQRTVAAGFKAMRETGADFVVSGEVVGQRPMSQRRDAITLTDKAVASWGFAGLFLRPLSAKLLEPTIPEKEGWIDGDCLFDISGRGRERQMTLAEKLELGDYPSPAGGCLLTDAEFSRKLATLMLFKENWTARDVELLKVGRHFQISPGTKIVASRREEENYRLRELAEPEDRLFINNQRPGAIVLRRGPASPETDRLAGGLAVYFSKMRDDGSAEVESWTEQDGKTAVSLDMTDAVPPTEAKALEATTINGNALKIMRGRIADGKKKRNAEK